MKFDVDDKNRCRLVCVKFHLNRCRFAVAVAKCLGGSLFWDTVYICFIMFMVMFMFVCFNGLPRKFSHSAWLPCSPEFSLCFIVYVRECSTNIQLGKFTSAKWRSAPWRTATSTANSTSNFAGKSKSRYDKLTTTAGKLFSLQVNYYASVVLNDTALPKSYLLLLGNSITHSLSHSRLKTFLVLQILPIPALPFSSSGFTTWISQTV